MNQSVAMQHVIEEICRLEPWDKDQLSAATKNLLWSIEQPPYSKQADTVCCFLVSRCQSESSSHDGYTSSDSSHTPRSNEQQLHYPSHAHMNPGDVLHILPGPVTQLEDIIRKCEVTFGPDYKEMLLQAFSDYSDSSFFYELDIPWILDGRTRTYMQQLTLERTEELIILLKINTKVLWLMQQQLCEQSRPFEELKIGYFALFAKCPIKKLLEIALCLSETVWSHTHICLMLLAYEALTDVLPLIEKFPSSESADFFANIVCNMREAFRRSLDHIKHFIQMNREKHQGVAIHPMTCFLVCSMRFFDSHRNLVQSTLAPDDNSISNSHSFGHLLHGVITCWKSVLTEHSNIYCTDLLWQYIFLLNNTEHFSKKTEEFLEALLSDRQVIEQHDDDFKSWIESYTEEACAPAKSCLTRSYLWGSPLVAFTSKFSKTFDRQEIWEVPDVDLREELKRRIQECLLPDYSSSLEKCSSSGPFCSCLQIGSARDVHTSESLRSKVQGLYEG